MKKIIVFVILAASVVFLVQRHAPIAQAGEMDSVRSITLPTMPPDLKEGPGKDKVMTFCTICHSLDYISMQPHLPAKNWSALVQKMIKVFGAPIGEEDAKTISTYLAAQYGASEK